MVVKQLKDKAKNIRIHILDTIYNAGKGHIGGAFSCTDILVALYYGNILRYDVNNLEWSERDRFILSKGHSGVALFSILVELGVINKKDLDNYCLNGSFLGGHPDIRIKGVEVDTGSLGQGLGIAAGLSLAAKKDNKDYMTYVLMGDGECYEGSVWEAFMFASHHKLNNLVAIVDRNHQCVLNYTEDCIKLDPLEDKLNAFGWNVKVINGHSFNEIIHALEYAKTSTSQKPLAIIANTVKGKGVSFMEGVLKWHHGIPSEAEYQQAHEDILSS